MFDIQLGTFKATYIGYETTAPADYDGFGTISLHEGIGAKEPRWVLIRAEHEQWQTMRYRSGMYGVAKFNEQDGPAMAEMGGWITEKLYQRLVQDK